MEDGQKTKHLDSCGNKLTSPCLKLMRCEPISSGMKESVGTVAVVVFLFVPACIPMHSGRCSPVVLPGSVDK